jgi:molybdopterin/thiamine biosynthesis adenylyltransferase
VVSRSDLHRQTLYDVDSIGKRKVEVAFRKLNRLNPDVKLDPFPESLNSMNARELMDGVDVILDGLDRVEPRYVVNRTCNELNIPYVFGAAIEAFGNLSTIVPGQTLCLECFMFGLKDDDLPKCGVVGVHPSVLGIVTAVQDSEAVRLLIGREPKLLNKLFYIDLRELEFNILKMNRREDCLVCVVKASRLPEPLTDKFFEKTCARDGRRNFVISPKERIEIDPEKLVQILAKRGFRIKTSDNMGITFEASEGFLTSILKSGTMIAQASPKFMGDPKREVLDIYKLVFISDLGFSPE